MATVSTRLDAVNHMLAAVGQVPVDSLGAGLNAIADTAENLIDAAERDCLSQSWYFNTEYEVTYTPDSDGYIHLGDNVFHADSGDPSVHYVKRDQRLYNLTDHTYVFTSNVDLTIIYGLDWEDMPETARGYITARATRMLAERFDRDTAIIRAELRNEAEAMQRLTQEDADQADHNPLREDPTLYRANFFGGRSALERGI